MKRFWSLVLSLVLMASFASVSFAAVTVGGNARFWYQAAKDDNTVDYGSRVGFQFDRLALTLASPFSDTDGFKGEVQFRQTRNDAIGGTTTSSKYGTDIRVDNAYYYKKGLLLDKDEFDVGYIKAIPFNNGSYNVIVFDTLANVIDKDTNSIGIKYAKAMGPFDFAMAFVNASNKTTYDYDGGFDFGGRVNYVVIPGLKIGAGYIKDTGMTNSSAANFSSQSGKYSTGTVVDATYSLGSLGVYAEYLSYKKDNTSDYSTAGTYFELNYKVAAPLTVYAAREISLSDHNIFTDSTNSIAVKTSDSNGSDFKAKANWTAIGAKYQIASNTALQGEIVSVDESKTKQVAAIRCLINF